MDIVQEVLRAERRIRPHIRQTYLEQSPHFSRLTGANVYFKLENLQYTGSFKVRGATNKLLSLSPADRKREVVAASTGNHGAAVAFSARRLGAPAVVFVPEHAAPGKVAAIERWGATVEVYGQDSAESERHARQYAGEKGLTYVSPYNDWQVVGGQGTVGVELARQLDRIDAVFASLGGGGLVSGVAAYLKALDPSTRVVACSPANSQVMIDSLQAGRILDLPSLPTLSDGTAGGVEAGSITFEMCQALLDETVTVTEEEIAAHIRAFMQVHPYVIEGSAAVALAGFLQTVARYTGQNVVVVLCGGNIDPTTLRAVLGTREAEEPQSRGVAEERKGKKDFGLTT